MKKTTPILLIIIAILFVTVLYLLYLNLNKSPITSSTPTTGVLPIEETTPTIVDETADWKTYTNTKYNFSLKYPSKYISDLQSIHSSDLRESTEGEARTYVTAYFGIKAQNQKCSPTFSNYPQATVKKIDFPSNLDISLFETFDPIAQPYSSRVAYINNGEKSCITINCSSTENDCTDNELGKEFLLMLSSLKFTNETTSVITDDTADWKTYKNNTLGFSIKYFPTNNISNNDSNTETLICFPTNTGVPCILIKKESQTISAFETSLKITPETTVKKSTVILSGVSATKFVVSSPQSATGTDEINYYLMKASNNISIKVLDLSIHNQILSTLKFL